MDGIYLIPANSKKSVLIFGMFRWIDIGIGVAGAAVSFILFTIFRPAVIWDVVLIMLPLFFCALLITPVPYQHNVLTFIRNVIDYFTNRRIYKWRGWCIADGDDDEY